MQKLLETYTPETTQITDDNGVVAIEYVLVAGLVAAGVAVLFATGLWTTMLGKLNALFP